MGPWSRVAGLGVNTLAGGFFHLATWVHVLAGTAATVKAWRDGRRPQSRSFHTGLVLGWGVSTWSKESSTTGCWGSTTSVTTWAPHCRETSGEAARTGVRHASRWSGTSHDPSGVEDLGLY
jgi:hypothetical protein